MLILLDHSDSQKSLLKKVYEIVTQNAEPLFINQDMLQTTF